MKKRDKALPIEFTSLDEASEFWDTHDSAPYSRFAKRVRIRVDLRSEEFWFPVGEDLYRKLRTAASRRRTDPERLLKRWVSEKLQAETAPT